MTEMLSFSAQSIQSGQASDAQAPVETVKNAEVGSFGRNSAVLGASVSVWGGSYIRGGVNGRMDEARLGNLTSFQGGHGQELAVDHVSAVDSFGLSNSFNLGGGSGGTAYGYARSDNNADVSNGLDPNPDNAVMGELSVLSDYIALMAWSSFDFLMTPFWKLLMLLVDFLSEDVSRQSGEAELSIGFQQGEQKNVFSNLTLNAGKTQPFSI